jgi:hypothetical protein
MIAIAAGESIQQGNFKGSLKGVGNTMTTQAHAGVSYLHSLSKIS